MNNSYATGPALDEEQARKLADLLKNNNWLEMDKYLDRVKDTAVVSLRKRNISAEDSGYYKGIIQIIEDIQVMPISLSKQIYGEVENE